MAGISNTGEKQIQGGPFRQGDPRINRKGRPKSFDALRELARQIAHATTNTEGAALPTVTDAQGVVHQPTIAEAILWKWAGSKDPRLQMHFMEVAFGKVPITAEVTGTDGGPLVILLDK